MGWLRGHAYDWTWPEEPDPESNPTDYLHRIATDFKAFLVAYEGEIMLGEAKWLPRG